MPNSVGTSVEVPVAIPVAVGPDVANFHRLLTGLVVTPTVLGWSASSA